MTTTKTQLTQPTKYDDPSHWHDEGHRRFGRDQMAWRFVCPACGHVTKVDDYKKAGAPESAIAFSCVGRWTDGAREAFSKGAGPCTYAGGGLFGLNPITVVDGGKEHRMFAFDEADPRAIATESATTAAGAE